MGSNPATPGLVTLLVLYYVSNLMLVSYACAVGYSQGVAAT